MNLFSLYKHTPSVKVICVSFVLFQDECYNYIKVLLPRNDETLFACGTNALNPTCRNYRVSLLHNHQMFSHETRVLI